MRTDGIITSTGVCAFVCCSHHSIRPLFLPLSHPSLFMSDVCLPISLSTGSDKCLHIKSTDIIASTLEKLLRLYLPVVMAHYGPQFCEVSSLTKLCWWSFDNCSLGALTLSYGQQRRPTHRKSRQASINHGKWKTMSNAHV